MRFFFKIVKILILFLLFAFVGAGFYAGNTAYETMLTAPWEKILGVTKQTADLSRIHRREQKDGWQPVEIRSADRTKLRGTYIENSRSSDRTVILLHGLYQNRSMCIPYVDMYRDMGYMSSSSTSGATEKAAAAIPPGVFVKQTILMPGQSG